MNQWDNGQTTTQPTENGIGITTIPVYIKIGTTVEEKEIIQDNQTTLIGSPYIIDRETLPPQAVPTIPTSSTKCRIPRVLKIPTLITHNYLYLMMIISHHSKDMYTNSTLV